MPQDYKSTLNLPQTDFPMKAQLAKREPEMLKAWDEMNVYHRMVERNAKAKPFIFHDGPPYANGHIHHGTVLNKVLKDIVVKYQNMTGHYCVFVPGWDCHGLPIELAVERAMKENKQELVAEKVRIKCRKHAEKFVGIQREEFKRLGCFGRWEKPYITMSHDYEASIAREFGKFVEKGLVYKAKKPVYWCASCQTALAEAEVEYADHTSPSIFVKFQLEDEDSWREQWGLKDEPINIIIWTTTPWTIPANLGIALHPDLPYVAAKVNGEVWILAEGLLDNVMEAVGKSYSTIVGRPSSRDLENKHCRHPLIDRQSLIILGDHVTLEAGTGAVHTAPGHGQDDYDVGMRYGLEPLAPIDNGGHFTDEAGLPWLTGLFVEEANAPIIDHLREKGALVATERISHSYPHCWRCKKAIVFRSTEQWFVSMDKTQLRQKALKEIDKVRWIPHWGKNRISGMIEVRPDWCISRQRIWGVPIVAVGCKACGCIHTTKELIDKAADLFEESGADAWYTEPVERFLPKGFACPDCGATEFAKERDILDVWFDSGVSYAAVLENEEKITDQADLYLEGSDQHRGWFHTALLTSVATRGRAPYRTVLTHGFVVDAAGRKYSKSSGNYAPPQDLIDKHGAEILRMWVASEDYRDDIRFSDEIVTRLIDSYRKIRNTVRYLLGNMSDFDPAKDQVDDASLPEIDRWAMAELEALTEKVTKAYENYEFHQIFHALNRFCTVELSSFYLDILKDRIYTEKKDGVLRRAAQTTMWRVADAIVRLMAPVFSFTADEIWRYLPKDGEQPDSVFLVSFPPLETKWRDDALTQRWHRLGDIRAAAQKALEGARAAKFIGNALSAKLIIECSDDTRAFLESFGKGFADLFIVSGVEFGPASGEYVCASEEEKDLKVAVQAAEGTKCARCWRFATSVGAHDDHPEICDRCYGVVT